MSLERFTRKEVANIDVERPSREAAELMRVHHVGAIVVTDGDRPVGIVTDRDIALRLVANNRDPGVPVREIMSPNLALLRDSDSIDQAVTVMRRHGVRRLPIVDEDGALVGLVALDDLLVLLTGELSSTVEAVLDNRGP